MLCAKTVDSDTANCLLMSYVVLIYLFTVYEITTLQKCVYRNSVVMPPVV